MQLVFLVHFVFNWQLTSIRLSTNQIFKFWEYHLATAPRKILVHCCDRLEQFMFLHFDCHVSPSSALLREFHSRVSLLSASSAAQ